MAVFSNSEQNAISDAFASDLTEGFFPPPLPPFLPRHLKRTRSDELPRTHRRPTGTAAPCSAPRAARPEPPLTAPVPPPARGSAGRGEDPGRRRAERAEPPARPALAGRRFPPPPQRLGAARRRPRPRRRARGGAGLAGGAERGAGGRGTQRH